MFNIGGRDNDTAAQMNQREGARKSTSIPHNQVTVQNSDNVKQAKTGKNAQKSGNAYFLPALHIVSCLFQFMLTPCSPCS